MAMAAGFDESCDLPSLDIAQAFPGPCFLGLKLYASVRIGGGWLGGKNKRPKRQFNGVATRAVRR
jgi:hypothetical protein